jgi:hypothetical protein
MSPLKTTMAIIGFCAVLTPGQSAFAVEGRIGTVKACSAVMAGKCTTGAVRNTGSGQQVQLPGVSVVECFETVRGVSERRLGVI